MTTHLNLDVTGDQGLRSVRFDCLSSMFQIWVSRSSRSIRIGNIDYLMDTHGAELDNSAKTPVIIRGGCHVVIDL